ncbi:MAG: UDP-N-acetylglucosamine--N-acetylmuramyl-(pentapeptide) pyrophosphoryl-undecaprenol N-acetylglucosamine transferase [Candidatus Pacebacteria bacterium]|nr:UDP-N-acetylglucosamine--N-acetylmuramyl-(pentapeptide) pyrophosphoryl-undecaprenol N-acetylglucosamine transferase [Candidatus Paceibacterota bacterium]
MKILFTGGGTGGHFYPIIAVAQEIKRLVEAEKLVPPELYFMAPDPYNRRLLFEEGIKFIPMATGKWRRYFSLLNFFDFFKTSIAVANAIVKIYFLYPDVVFSKGGFGAFPALVAARFLRIPVVMHESDSKPGRVSAWSGKFAIAIACSYPEAAKFFKESKTAVTGNPIRRELLMPIKGGAYEFLKLDPAVPTLFIVGGSLGAVTLNDTLLDILPELLNRYQIIHQVGKNNHHDVKNRSHFILKDHPHKERYHLFDYLNESAMRMVAAVAELGISRAGSAIFEFANWELPTILIPIPESISHDQHTNAFTYARSGAAVVIEESNLKPSVLTEEINRLMDSPPLREKMKEGARKFKRPEAGEIIAKQILTIALEHEK